jgi:hypothetical protein
LFLQLHFREAAILADLLRFPFAWAWLLDGQVKINPHE